MSRAFAGISAVGAYVPRLRLARARIAESIAWANPQARARSEGSRAICNWDEDALTLAVEAGRICLRHAARAGHSSAQRDGAGSKSPTASSTAAAEVRSLSLASTTLPFADRDNAAIAAGALDLQESLETLDFGATLRAGTAALSNAARRTDLTSLVIATDARHARPGSAQELSYGHGAAAFLIGPASDASLAVFLGSAHLSSDFVDHYRMSAEDFDYSLEERWVRDEGYSKLVPRAVAAALTAAQVAPGQITSLVMPALPAVAQRVAKLCGLTDVKLADSLHVACGDTGAAHPLLMLALALEKAEAGETILLIGFGQGADAIVLRTQPALSHWRGKSVSDALARGVDETSYVRYLSHAGLLPVDFGMRAERDNRTAHTVAYRRRRAVTGFVGGKCKACGTVQYPLARVCVNPSCRAADTQEEYRLADSEGRLKSFTEDWQAFSPRPPYTYGNVEFAEGGNVFTELTDVEPGELAVNSRVRFVFRVKDVDRLRGYKRYFWKATKA